MHFHGEILAELHGTSMFTDEFDSVSRVDQDVLGVAKFASEIVKVLLMRELDVEFLIWTRHGNLLILYNHGSRHLFVRT